ncbi:hypothetical protein [Nocardia panacis]|nr:hypothetical protein [Nocardia panacis]
MPSIPLLASAPHSQLVDARIASRHRAQAAAAPGRVPGAASSAKATV